MCTEQCPITASNTGADVQDVVGFVKSNGCVQRELSQHLERWPVPENGDFLGQRHYDQAETDPGDVWHAFFGAMETFEWFQSNEP